jgi:hypothetical protein
MLVIHGEIGEFPVNQAVLVPPFAGAVETLDLPRSTTVPVKIGRDERT